MRAGREQMFSPRTYYTTLVLIMQTFVRGILNLFLPEPEPNMNNPKDNPKGNSKGNPRGRKDHSHVGKQIKKCYFIDIMYIF